MRDRPPLPPDPAPAVPAIAQWRGAVRLAVEGIHGVTRIAQGLHGSITGLAPPLGRRRERPAGGIAGLVYGSVRGGSSLVGSALDALLAGMQVLSPQEAGQPSRDSATGGRAIVSALNGIVGDHLARSGNPLAVPMELIVAGPASSRVLLLVHGLCMDDRGWRRKGHDHGAALAQALGCTPVYLRYNSGRHVSENGAELAQRLQELVAQWPVPIDELAILGHSMGGLVARSAAQQGRAAGMAWPKRVRKMVFLGTPHHGAALERGGNWLHTVLGTSPYLAPFTRLGRLRSDGITDLRHGNLLASDWERGRFQHRDTRCVVPLPSRVRCYAVAGALGRPSAEAALGDGLVSVSSALGRHVRNTHDLRLPASHTWVARGVHHLDLLSDQAVYARLLAWLR